MRRFLVLVGCGAVALSAVLTLNTLRLPQPTAIPAVALTEIDVPAAAARLAGALRYRTVSYEDSDRVDSAAFLALHDYLVGAFPRVHAELELEKISELSLLYRWPGRNPGLRPVLLMAHMDVVPIEEGTFDRWSHPPFEGVIEGRQVIGRGAMDDKAGVMGILEAVETLMASGYSPEQTIYLAFGHDEEVGGWQGAAKVAERLRQRGVRLRWVVDEGGLIGDGLIPGIERPVALVGVAEKGSVNIELRAQTGGGHSSVAQEATAIGILSRAIVRIESQQPQARLAHPMPEMLRQLAPYSPWPNRVAIANLWLFAPMISHRLEASNTTRSAMQTLVTPTVIAAGDKANVLPSQAQALLNVRLLPGDTAEAVTRRIREVIDDDRVEVRMEERWAEASPVTDTDSDAYRLVEQSIYEASFDLEPVVVPFLMIGGTDAKHYVSIADHVLRFLALRVTPDDLDRFHGTDERIAFTDYERMIRFYVRLIRNASEGGEA